MLDLLQHVFIKASVGREKILQKQLIELIDLNQQIGIIDKTRYFLHLESGFLFLKVLKVSHGVEIYFAVRSGLYGRLQLLLTSQSNMTLLAGLFTGLILFLSFKPTWKDRQKHRQ